MAIRALENATEETLHAQREFGEASVPQAEFWDQAYLHAAFTIGQIVANFRKHGMAPPAFVFF